MVFELKSPAIGGSAPIPQRYTGDGANLSPPLEWSDPPPQTKSLALIVEDPDAPGGMFRHWGLYNIDAGERRLPEGAGDASRGKAGGATVNDFGEPGYGGPKPPRGHGPHHYHFKLVALDVDKLDLSPSAQASDIWAAARGHILAQTELVGTYAR
jgi:Raf kinase inhibitor-like YbhB/YbcL family protein